ncbi:hypothetical protein BCR42DRAFT_342853 [Absidia repens]|uniref:Alpha/Beta hydrolase protein n=1 Tax=Absidia repens TaxID=90262 RepID=A0A1X2IYY8_9FUNG|nr:hypothetical protein BCR42DRAFT_342853 [Absidia repens]
MTPSLFYFVFLSLLLHFVACLEFKGTLFTYHNSTRLTAFESGAEDSDKAFIFLEGLGDGYNGVPYLGVLNDAVTKLGYSLYQIQTTSFYKGYGASSLANDAKELDYLIGYLKEHRNKKHFVVMGHSTGCQDSYWHNKNGQYRKDVSAYILQAPASDREWYADDFPGWPEHLKLATRMREEGRGSEWMPRSISEIPVTADRFFSLYSHGGDDDVFSTDLTDEELDHLYKDVNQPMLAMHGEIDEYYRSPVDQMVILKRLQKACPAFKKIAVIPGATHKVVSPQAQTVLVELVSSFLDTIDNS